MILKLGYDEHGWKFWSELRRGPHLYILTPSVYDIWRKQNRVLLSSFINMYHWTLKEVFLSTRIREKRWFSSLGMTSMDARIGRNSGGGNICTFKHHHPLKVRCKWKKLTQLTVVFAIHLFLCYITKIKSCFALIIQKWVLLNIRKGVLVVQNLRIEVILKLGYEAWMHVLVRTEEGETTAHFSY